MNGADAVNAAVRSINRSARNAELRRYRREARRLARRELVARGVELTADDYVDISCPSLCVNCRRLGPAFAAPGQTPTSPCPSCGNVAWVDLRHSPSVDAVRDLDSYDVMAREKDGKRIARRIGAVVRASVIFGLVLVALGVVTGGYVRVQGLNPFMLICMALMFAGALQMLVRWLGGRFARSSKKVAPARWLLRGPKLRPRPTGATGLVHGGSMLRAPLSGRPCVAYEVGVRRDDDCDGELGTWLVLEQHNQEFSAAGLRFPAEGAALRFERRRFANDDAPSVGVFLRSRGILTADAPFRLYESILEPGDIVEVSNTPVVPVVHSPPGARWSGKGSHEQAEARRPPAPVPENVYAPPLPPL